MHVARTVIFAFILSCTIGFLGCSGSSGPTVARINGENISLGEYEKQYIRNNGGVDAALKSTMDERKDFLNLLVKYRLKVLEAKSKGYDKDPEVRNELTEYRQSLATPYLTERELIDPYIKKLYERRLDDVHASHIMIAFITDSIGVQDTMATLNKAKDVLKLAQTGVPFDSLARQYSADTRRNQNGGDLGFFTAGMTLPVFDDAVYSLKPGQLYSYPVRTPFGYHVVKLIDRRKSRGRLRPAHILVRLPVENPSDSAAAFAKISLILDTLLNKGGKFEELAMRNSEDPVSGANGGDLGFAEAGKFVPQFAEAAFALKVGEISGVVRSPFGYHIIKALEEAPPKSFEEQRQELKDLYQRYGYQEDNEKFIGDIKQKHEMMIHNDVIAKILAHVDSSVTTSAPKWDSLLTDDVRSSALISFKGKKVAVQQAIDKIRSTQDLQTKQLNTSGFVGVADKIGELEAIALETKDLESRYPDFGQLMHEYEEGVLLFRAEQEAVWNKVSINDSMLQAYWEQHKEVYKWPDRISFSEIFVSSDSLAKVMIDSARTGKDFGELAARHTMRTGYREKKGSWGFTNEEANDLSRAAFKMKVGDISEPLNFQYGKSIIKVDEKDPARIKTFKEAASEVSSKFQELESKRIEKEWIETLRKKFGVEEYFDMLKETFKDLKPSRATSSAAK